MLGQQIHVENTVAASNADFLAGTQLDQPGVPGVYSIWCASTVGDSTVTISLGGRVIVDAAVIVERANEEIRIDEDVVFQMVSQTGGRPVIALVVVSATIIRVRVIFIPAFPS